MNDLEKTIKSLFTSLGIILLYFYATVGVVKLFGNTKNDYRFEGRVKFLLLFSALCSIIYIIGIYHLVGVYKVDYYYQVFLIYHVFYILIGFISNMLIKR
jgi:hypothetical protein